FSIDDIRHKHGLTIRARDAFPAKGDIGDLKLHSSCHPERSRGIPDEFTFTLPRRDPSTSVRFAQDDLVLGAINNRARKGISSRCRAQAGTPRSRHGSTEYRLAVTDNSFADKPA